MGKKILQYWIYLAVCTFSFQAAIFLIQPAAAQTVDSRPNIIVILTDNMGWGDIDRLNDAGAKLMPHLDSLAQNGVRMNNFHSSAPNCSPSRASLLTGRMPQRHQVSNRGGLTYLPQTEKTISKFLCESGYDTAIFGKWHLGSSDVNNRPESHGFKYWYTTLSGVFPQPTGILFREGYATDKCESISDQSATYYALRDFGTSDPRNSEMDGIAIEKKVDKNWWSKANMVPIKAPSGEIVNKIQSIPYLITTKVVDYIKTSSGKPFFIYVPYPSPHLPIDASISDVPDGDCEGLEDQSQETPKCYSRVYQELRTKCAVAINPSYDDKLKYQLCFDIEGLRDSNGFYKKALEDIDNNIFRIREALREKGILDNTMIFFTSDNGAENGIHLDYENAKLNPNTTNGLHGGYRFLYEGGTRVPFVASWPTKQEGVGGKWLSKVTVPDQLADLTDIFSTIAYYAGVDTGSTPIDGIDIHSLLENNQKLDKVLMHTYIEARETVNPCEYPESGCASVNSTTTTIHQYSYPHAIQVYTVNDTDKLNDHKLFLDFDYSPRELYAGLISNPTAGETNNLLSKNDPAFIAKLKSKAVEYEQKLGEEPTHFYFPISEIQNVPLNANDNVISIRGRDSGKKLQARILFYKKGGANPDQDPIGYRNVFLKEGEIFYAALNDICNKDSKCMPYGDMDGSPVHSFPDFTDGAIAVHTSSAADVTIINKGLNYSWPTKIVAKNNRRAAVPRNLHYLPKIYDGFTSTITAGGNNVGTVSYENELVIWNVNDEKVKVKITRYNGAGEALKIGPEEQPYIIQYLDPYQRVKIIPRSSLKVLGETSVSGSLKLESLKADDSTNLVSSKSPLAVNLLFRLNFKPVPASLNLLGDVSVYQHSEQIEYVQNDPIKKGELYFPLIQDGKKPFPAPQDEEYVQLITIYNPNTVEIKKIDIWFGDTKVPLNQTIKPNGKFLFRPSYYCADTAGVAYCSRSVKIKAYSSAIDETAVQPVIGFYDTTFYKYPNSQLSDIAYDIYSSSPLSSKLIFPRISNNSTEKSIIKLMNPSFSEPVTYYVEIYNYTTTGTFKLILPTTKYSEDTLNPSQTKEITLPSDLNNGAVIVTTTGVPITGSAMAYAIPNTTMTAISTIEPITINK